MCSGRSWRSGSVVYSSRTNPWNALPLERSNRNPRSPDTHSTTVRSRSSILAVARSGPPGLEASGLPHLELLPQADEGNVARKAGVRAKRFRKHDASVLIDAEGDHVAVERDRQLVPLVRIIRQAVEKPVDVRGRARAACSERRSGERGVAVEAAVDEAVVLQHGAEGGRNGHPPLGVDLVDECRNKALHPLLEPRLTPFTDH